MGSHIQIYIGSYLEVPKIDGIQVETYFKCENNDCKVKKKNGKFCPECGTKSTEHKIEHKVLVSPIPIDDELHDVLYEPHAGGAEISKKIDWLLPISDKIKYHNLDGDDIGGFEYSNPEEAITAFKEEYADWIKKIEDAGGTPSVKYGTFIHYS